MNIKNSIFLKIISSTSAQELSIEWIEIESPTGSFLVGHDHSPLISLLKKSSVMLYKTIEGQEVALDIHGGIFKIVNNKATVLLS